LVESLFPFSLFFCRPNEPKKNQKVRKSAD
jgi:hypothetical protein